MKNKITRKKVIANILKIIILITFLYSLIYIIRSGKQVIKVKTVSNFFSGSNLESIISVSKRKTEEDLKSKIKVELLDNNNHKVKKVKGEYKVEKGEEADISIKLPEDLESGRYNLKVTSKSGILKDTAQIPINITKAKETETIISLDKGIYKPGDDINYRALIISKKDNTPINEEQINISIFDGNDNKVYSNDVKTNDFGIVFGDFKLSDTVNSGTYKLTVSSESEEITKTFTVNPYVTPKFEVTISTDKESYLIGEKALVTVNAKYFFGEPVANANVSGIVDGEEFVGLTDANGTFTKEVEVKEAKQYKISLSVEDESNYFVENTKTFVGATDVFEVEITPEYADLISGIDNDIYIITKTADNKPVKTYINAQLDTIKREVITDENGIGKLTLTSSEISTMYGNKTLLITAENMNGQKVSKELNLNINNNSGAILKTDKVIYEEDEDIDVSVKSMLDNTSSKHLYIFKGNELVKTISFEENDIKFNLDGIFGLVDICLDTERHFNYNLNSVKNYNNENYGKKTVFIKPNKNLNIDIETDSDEYKPKDTLKINFDVSNEENQNTDAALLVSILDEAVLTLADNDLSVDNLKIALGDIELSDGMTMADLYAMVLNDSNQTALSSILLNQNKDKNVYVNTNNEYNYNLEKYITVAVISGTILAVIVICTVLNKSQKIRKISLSLIIAFADIVVIFLILATVFGEQISDLFWDLNRSGSISIAVCAVISIVIYNLILYKQKNYIFGLVIELGLVPGIFAFILYVLTEMTMIEELPLVIIAIMLLVLCALVSISRKKKLNGFWNSIKYTLMTLTKGLFVWLAVALVCSMIDSPLGLIIVLIAYILFDKFVLQKTNIKFLGNSIEFDITGNELIGVVVGIIFVIIIVGLLYVMQTSTASINNSVTRSDFIIPDESSSFITQNEMVDDSINFDDIKGSFTNATDDTIGIQSSSGLESFDIFDSFSSNKNSNEEEQIIQKLEKDIKTEENVRNVFLESLAFVPSVITNEGKADLELKVSDNITTWNIQTIGNSKDGRVGFASKNFKVFKEFFVDFSLPTNTVITDKVSIPVTVYNYTENALDVTVKAVENDWAKIGEYTQVVNVPANGTQMIYIPLEITKAGNNTLRIESQSGSISDIVEKQMTTKINGFEKETVVSSGSFEKTLEQDILFREEAISETKKIRVKLYPSGISQVIENMDSILEMPSGCFEQTSSSLYPDLLALKYLKDNNMNSPEIEKKALEYISAGYQKLLTYEVPGTKGGYSLYGNKPAEPVLTAFGLMEMNDLQEVYSVDENVIENMKEYLFKEQKVDGSFDYKSTYIGNAESTDDLAMNAYIIWALSEVCPEDSRLEKSVSYLERKLDSAKDNYTLALIANVFSNTKNSNTNKVIERLMKNVVSEDNNTAYISSNIRGYLGCWGIHQNIQTTALTSLALTKAKSNDKTNNNLINYIIKCKDSRGTWYNTQSTILALKAINEINNIEDAKGQTVKVTLNGESKDIEIGDNVLDVYDLEFTNVDTENKISISMKKGKISYEIIKEYYETYEQTKTLEDLKSSGKIIVNQTIMQEVNVNDIVTQKISLSNLSDDISNMIVRITIPQGCSVVEDSLLQLEFEGKVEKFEYNYNTVDLYLRNFSKAKEMELTINYRASYPETILGGAIRAYDYYNPEMEGICMPVQINVK